MYAIGIDIGGMSAKLGLIQEGRVLEQKLIPTESGLDYEGFLVQLVESIRPWMMTGRVERAGISSCGLIDSTNGMILYSNNIRWQKKQIVRELEQAIQIPIRIANDAKCAALAEAVYGVGRDYRRLCMITLGTGVGGGFIVDGHLAGGDIYADTDGTMGHITVENGGRQCTCGRQGCLEAYASATALMKQYEERTHTHCTASEIFEKARRNEEAAAAAVEEFRFYLGEGLTSLVNILRPEIIALGGGVAKSADLFLDYLNGRVNSQIFGGDIVPVRIVQAIMGNDAGMVGATLL